MLLRASSFGNIMTESKGNSITENQLKEIDDLISEMENGVNANGNKVKWTDVKASKLQDLINKRDAPTELSQTAKSEVEKIWLANEKGYVEDLNNKYLTKGLMTEEDGLELISELDGEFYIKNTERITKGNISGEADVVFVKDGVKIIKDIKSCYNPKTFLNSTMDNIYEYQGRVYMYLYGAEEFHLEFTLNDLPEFMIQDEIYRTKNKFGIIDIDDPMAKPLFEQIRQNFTYSTNPAYTKEERRKTFIIKRDLEIEQKMLDKIPLCLEYYKTITLNGKK